jgi:hypothetical protein
MKKAESVAALLPLHYGAPIQDASANPSTSGKRPLSASGKMLKYDLQIGKSDQKIAAGIRSV